MLVDGVGDGRQFDLRVIPLGLGGRFADPGIIQQDAGHAGAKMEPRPVGYMRPAGNGKLPP